MRRFLLGVFVVSLLAVGGTYYWRTYHPEGLSGPPMAAASRSVQRHATPDDGGAQKVERVEKAASERQDLAVIVSIASSVISAFAAVLQAWFTRQGLRA